MSTRHWNRSRPPLIAMTAIVAALCMPAASRGDITTPGQEQAQPIENGRSYGYVRTLEGRATMAHSSLPGEKSVAVNQPLLVGEEIAVASGSRLELMLSDHNAVRLAGGSEVRLERMAFSADSEDRTTLLRLLAGEMQIVVSGQSLGDQLPRIDTANATVYIEQPGSYRVGILNGSRTEVVVRDGYAEVLTPDGSAIVRDNEEAWVEGSSNVRVALRQAEALDRLEGWGDELDQ
ncbi:MAG TPA: FecR family protein, partial [Thermoanaerobaculia bacterium]|nr:FecR family protein [Thermoanaerobaculia bacterium]